MALLTVQQVALTGLVPTLSTPASSDTFVNNGKTYLWVKNSNAATRDVTITSLVPCDQGTTHHPVVTVPVTTGDKIIGPFETRRFNDAYGVVTVGYSATAGVTAGVFTL